MALQKPNIPGLYFTQLIGSLSVFIPITFLGSLGYLTRPVLVTGAIVTVAVLVYWIICSIRQKKTGYALLLIIMLPFGFLMWYHAYFHLCVDRA